MASVSGGGSGLLVRRVPFTTWAQERVAGSVRFDNRRLDNVPLRPSRKMDPRDSLPATGPEEVWKARRRHAPAPSACPRRPRWIAITSVTRMTSRTSTALLSC
jgi:hypothetical protein